jgi:hypothetical protein
MNWVAPVTRSLGCGSRAGDAGGGKLAERQGALNRRTVTAWAALGSMRFE